MARQKKTIISGITREAMEDAFGEYATADARIQKIQADMDVQFTKIREKFADELAELQQTKDRSFEILNVFASEHREDLFQKKKSLDTVHGTLGFRIGMPKLVTRKGYKWAAVIDLLMRQGKEYLNTAVTVAKDKFIADRNDEKVQSLMHDCGIECVQDETFYVEPQKEEAPGL